MPEKHLISPEPKEIRAYDTRNRTLSVVESLPKRQSRLIAFFEKAEIRNDKQTKAVLEKVLEILKKSEDKELIENLVDIFGAQGVPDSKDQNDLLVALKIARHTYPVIDLEYQRAR